MSCGGDVEGTYRPLRTERAERLSFVFEHVDKLQKRDVMPLPFPVGLEGGRRCSQRALLLFHNVRDRASGLTDDGDLARIHVV